MGFNLKNILNDARQLDQAAVAQVNPFDGGKTFASVRQAQANDAQAAAAAKASAAAWAKNPDRNLTQQMLATNLNKLPMDNLDGTFTGQQPNTAIYQTGGTWQPPLLPGHTSPRGVAFYNPTGNVDQQYTDDSYYALPINPAVVPQPMQPLRQMIPGGAY